MEICSQELLSRWEKIVQNHRQYDNALQCFDEWCKDINARLEAAAPNRDDRRTLEAKLSMVQELVDTREEGYERVADVVIQAEAILYSTSPAGRDAISSVTHDVTLQTRMSDLVSRIDEIRGKLDAAVIRWKQFDVAVSRFSEWLSSVETTTCKEDFRPTTLAERKSQLERALVTIRLIPILCFCTAIRRMSYYSRFLFGLAVRWQSRRPSCSSTELTAAGQRAGGHVQGQHGCQRCYFSLRQI